MRRISIIGTSGSGKTTVAGQLAERLGIPHVELDAIHWLPNWKMMPTDRFREQVAEATSGDAWVADGNYSKVRDIIWKRADTVVWLDFSLQVLLWRLCWRIIRRTVKQEDLWDTGNRESLWQHLCTRDSLILWVLQTYRRRRREYSKIFAQPEYAHLQLVRLHSPQETEHWLGDSDLFRDIDSE